MSSSLQKVDEWLDPCQGGRTTNRPGRVTLLPNGQTCLTESIAFIHLAFFFLNSTLNLKLITLPQHCSFSIILGQIDLWY